MSARSSHGRKLADDHLARLAPEHRIAELEREVSTLRRQLDGERRLVAAAELARDLPTMSRRPPRMLRFTSDGWVHA